MRGLFLCFVAVAGCFPEPTESGSILIEGNVEEPDLVEDTTAEAYVGLRQVGTGVEVVVSMPDESTGDLVIGVSDDWGGVIEAVVPLEGGYGGVVVPLEDPCGAIGAGAVTIAVWTDADGDPWVESLRLYGEVYGEGDWMGAGDFAVFCGAGPIGFSAYASAVVVSDTPGTVETVNGSADIGSGLQLGLDGDYTFVPAAPGPYVLTVSVQ